MMFVEIYLILSWCAASTPVVFLGLVTAFYISKSSEKKLSAEMRTNASSSIDSQLVSWERL